MTIFIIMNAGQAAAIRGISKNIGNASYALEPVLLADGVTYVLPTEVLDNGVHVLKHAVLGQRTKREVAPEEWAVGGGPS